ncbi:MAG: MarP family serine protease [Actinomycetota bacterium]
MNFVDLIIAVFALALAVIGYERGLIASGLPLAGFVLGAAIGGRLGPALLAGGGESPYAPLITVLAGLVLGATVAVVVEGFAVGLSVRLSRGALGGWLDGIGGAALLAALGLLLAWAFGAAALNSPGPGERDLRDALQSSRILTALNNALPPSGPLLNVLRHIDPTPAISGPNANVRAPEPAIADDPDVQRAGDSVVKILGTACGLGIEGSGWVAGPGLVVTNAHVVAGEEDTTVTLRSGETLDASAVHYEPRNDLAILRVADLDLPALRLAPRVPRGAAAAVLGYPENGPLTISPARVGSTGEVISQDSYGRGPVRRRMTPFRGRVLSGNSGGPAVDASGQVLTTVFAAEQGRGRPGGLGVPDPIVRRALQGNLRPADTGPCSA